jgi:hypothetical protein
MCFLGSESGSLAEKIFDLNPTKKEAPDSVADPDLGAVGFLTTASGIRDG